MISYFYLYIGLFYKKIIEHNLYKGILSPARLFLKRQVGNLKKE